MDARKKMLEASLFSSHYFALPLCILLGILFGVPEAHAQTWGAQGFYAQSDEFWDRVDELENSADTATVLAKIFDEQNGSPTEGMGSAGIYYASEKSPFGITLFDRGIFAIESEAVAGGHIRNRISPELDGYTAWNAGITTGVQKHLEIHEHGWGLLALSSTGFGKQRLIDGEVTAYLSNALEEENSLFYQGFDLGVQYQSQWGKYLRFRSSYYFMPTYFHAQNEDDEYLFGVGEGNWVKRWRTQFEVTTRTAGFNSAAVEIGATAIGGPQPIPMPILPRLWDGVHNIDPFPAFGAAVGLGGVIRLINASQKFFLETFAGFYGGYWGAGAALKIWIINARVGSFGVEQSANYKLRETRINFIDGGISYVW